MVQILENSALGAVMILAVALARRAFRGRVSPNVVLLLWAVCIVRLLTPVELKSPISPYPVPARTERAAGGYSQELSTDMPMEAGDHAAPAPEVGAEQVDAGPAAERISAGEALGAVYAVVTASALAASVAAWLRLRKRVRALPAVARELTPGALPKRARLRVGHLRGAPLTFGAVRPSVVVTPELEGENLSYVIAHEAVHARRLDNLWHYAAAVAVCVHWFNPAVWLMAALIRRDVEMSCDRAVVAGAERDARASYANVIISMSTAPSGAALASGFARRKTEERVINIMKYRKMTVAGVLAAALLVGAVAAIGLTPARAENAVSGPEQTEFVIDTGFPNFFDLKEGQLRYHVTRAWVARDESGIPETGKFKPYCNANPGFIAADDSGDGTGGWLTGGTPTFTGEDGSFPEDMYMVFVEVEITSDGACTEVYNSEGEAFGYMDDPYLFAGQNILELSDGGGETGEYERVYHPDFYSFYGEAGYDPAKAESVVFYDCADASLAFRLEPNKTRSVTLGYIIYSETGDAPGPSELVARPVSGLALGERYDGVSAELNLTEGA